MEMSKRANLYEPLTPKRLQGHQVASATWFWASFVI